jgi:hypothetical protein
MAQNIIIELIDDIDGGKADQTVSFALDSKSYEIDLNKKNAEKLRKAIEPFIAKARSASRAPAAPPKQRGASRGTQPKSKTLFSELDADEKDRFRAWSGMQSARRIGDARVQAWIDAGRP